MRIRRLNDAGLKWFREQLHDLREHRQAGPDRTRLTDDTISNEVVPVLEVDVIQVATKREAAELLGTVLRPLDSPELFLDSGLWAWLSLAFFDSLCPRKSGSRKVLADAHYVVDPDFRRRYRHLLATPVRVLWTIPVHNSLFLDKPVYQHGEMMEQLMSRLSVMRIPSVAEAADILYFDHDLRRPKVGIFPTKPQRGDLRNRFIARLDQLELTYDVHALTAPQLIELLGDEFNRWRA